ncbi:MAG: hypothetical protein LBP87_09720, partial [Planctomycetaceae bacterium]|nr:hypothetical protein [Planctomycetaceae bacterium]
SKVTGDVAAQLLANAREATIRANTARKSFEYGFCSEKTVQDAERDAETGRLQTSMKKVVL